MKHMFAIPVTVLVGVALSVPQAHASPDLRRAAILTTMAEAALASAALAHDHLDGGHVSLGWTAQYSERDWVFHSEGDAGGQPLSITMTGFLWGQDNDSWTLIYAGDGTLGGEIIRIHGHADWIYNDEISDYIDMDFRHVMRFGNNTKWGFVAGAEILIGGTIGAAGGMTAGPIVAAGAALTLGSALIGASVGIRELLRPGEAPQPPSIPDRPAQPSEGEVLVASEGMIYTAVSPEGDILGFAPDGIHVLSGLYYAEDNFAEGQIAPES